MGVADHLLFTCSCTSSSCSCFEQMSSWVEMHLGWSRDSLLPSLSTYRTYTLVKIKIYITYKYIYIYTHTHTHTIFFCRKYSFAVSFLKKNMRQDRPPTKGTKLRVARIFCSHSPAAALAHLLATKRGITKPLKNGAGHVGWRATKRQYLDHEAWKTGFSSCPTCWLRQVLVPDPKGFC